MDDAIDYKALLKKYMKYCQPQLHAAEVGRESYTDFNDEERAALVEIEEQITQEDRDD